MNIIELLGTSADLMQMIGPISRPNEGRQTVMGLHRAVEKSHRQAASRKAAGRWHPGHEIARDPSFVSGIYVDDSSKAHAIRRMNRAVARMHRLGLDADSIPNHIKRNAELARKQA